MQYPEMGVDRYLFKVDVSVEWGRTVVVRKLRDKSERGVEDEAQVEYYTSQRL